MEHQNSSPEVWYEKTWLVTLLCLVFPPLGLYALWKNSSISKGWKIGVTVVIGLFVLISIIPDPTPEGKTASNSGDTEVSESTPKYDVVKVKEAGNSIHCRVAIDDRYSRETLIELTRSLREQHNAKGVFVVHYHYKKYTEKTSPLAGIAYLEECNNCEYKDSEGELVDFPFYYMEKPAANALLALKFDTVGYKQEAVFLGTVMPVKNIIFSSNTDKALLVYQDQAGHSAHPLVKKVVNGEERFYEPKPGTNGEFYYQINKSQGFVDVYKDETLDLQHILEE